MASPIILGYWGIRSLGQPIRMLLGYKNVEFEEKIYPVGDAPMFDKAEWNNAKFTLGLDFPNLPYLIDGDVKMSESNAIMRYLARKYNLEGETEEEKRRIDILESVLNDFRISYINLTYFSRPQDFAKNLEKFKEDVQPALDRFDKFLGADQKFFASNRLTYIDFLVHELMDQHRLLSKDILDNSNNLQNFMISFEQVPDIKEFMKSNKCFKGPINNKYALFK